MYIVIVCHAYPQVELLYQLESSMPTFLQKKAYVRRVTIKPNNDGEQSDICQKVLVTLVTMNIHQTHTTNKDIWFVYQNMKIQYLHSLITPAKTKAASIIQLSSFVLFLDLKKWIWVCYRCRNQLFWNSLPDNEMSAKTDVTYCVLLKTYICDLAYSPQCHSTYIYSS